MALSDTCRICSDITARLSARLGVVKALDPALRPAAAGRQGPSGHPAAPAGNRDFGASCTVVGLLKTDVLRNITHETLIVLNDQSLMLVPGAARAAGTLMTADEVSQSCAAPMSDLLPAIESET